jgi:membrane protease YdiL (CAAX protease family)
VAGVSAPAPATATPDADARGLHRRLAVGFIGLAVVWGVSFNVESLPFFPTVVVGGLLTGAAGLWARRAAPEGSVPGLAVTPAHIVLAVGVTLAHVVASHLLFDLADAVVPAVGDTAATIYARTNETPLLPRLVLSGLLTAPFEELYWRGAFHPAMRDAGVKRFPQLPRMAVAVAVSAIGYTVFHVATWKLSLVAAAALGGLIWGWLLEHTRSLGATMIAHALWTSLMVLYPAI